MLSTNGHCPKRAVLYTRVSTDEQARSGNSLAQQIDADLYRATPRRLAPSAGQKGSTETTVAAAKARRDQNWIEERRDAQSIAAGGLVPLAQDGVLEGMAYEEAAPMHSRSLHLSTNDRKL